MRLASSLPTCATIVASLTLSAGVARATTPLAWSLSFSTLRTCSHSPCDAPALTMVKQDGRYGYGMNASSSVFDTTYGSAHADAAPGAGFFSLPELHAFSAGTVPISKPPFSHVVTVLDAVQGYKWTGSTAIDLGVDSFVGTIDATNLGKDYGYVSASLAIISGVLRGDGPLGLAWYKPGPAYSFDADCGTKGAIGIGETGVVNAKGAISRTVTPSCGSPTFHLNPGEEFFIWAKMQTFAAGANTVDASHTFSVGLSPSVSSDIVTALKEHLSIAAPLPISTAVPEPSTWWMLVLGFGGLGVALRRRVLAKDFRGLYGS